MTVLLLNEPPEDQRLAAGNDAGQPDLWEGDSGQRGLAVGVAG